MKIITIDKNDLGENIYIYHDENNGIIVDPGACFEEIKQCISQNNISISAILLTHGHFDHIMAASEVRTLTGAPIYCHREEKYMLENSEVNLSIKIGENTTLTPDKLVEDGQTLNFNGIALKVIHTPGHTTGGICFYDEKNANLFTGDTLFRESIGRTDLPMGNHEELISCIKNKLFTLPDDVTVYPGHGKTSTIKHEKEFNPFI